MAKPPPKPITISSLPKRHWTSERGQEASRKLLLGFTCKICEEKSHRLISHHAYTHGVVLVECPGCKNRHLIADNLGWFEQRGKAVNIQEILAQRGETIRTSWRQDEQGAILECLDPSPNHAILPSSGKEPSSE